MLIFGNQHHTLNDRGGNWEFRILAGQARVRLAWGLRKDGESRGNGAEKSKKIALAKENFLKARKDSDSYGTSRIRKEKRFDPANILSNLNVIMKLLNATLTVFALGVATVLAGPIYSKNPKSPMIVDPTCPCFFEGLQVGVFVSGVWGPDSLGNEYSPPGQGDDALGAGVSLAYYFTRNIALEYSYSWHDTESDRHVHTLDVLYRIPWYDSCFAPYLIGGVGLNTDGNTVGIYRAGGGVEYRLSNCVGIFADYTHNWIAGGDEGWGNDFNLARAGLRIPF